MTDVAKRRRQGLVVCRAALPLEGLCDARPGVALAPALIAPAAWRSADGLGVGVFGLAGEVEFGPAKQAVRDPDPFAVLPARRARGVSSRRSFLAVSEGCPNA